ncbi:TPA: ubiquinol-cytochrome C reductase [Klebsiella variicola]|uniref:ubiquinol-cytochrome C reductase n=1 Tax=Klebsiella variicola TaxID=244366 RepID=UPI001E52929C|nr:ubiquinol-cytochrome C reductase [Klebsiella variicola]MCD9950931.1 ubiquinol-cytochrome C reductase [Klebsiella variicola subsp. variicola]HCL6956108.1 ubiquinol-cytochrome C reductase [Klebsiella variicola]
MSLYNDLVRHDLDSCSQEEIVGVQNRSSEAVNDLMMGVKAIGSLMFWASDNQEYSEETAKEDMYRLGAMLGVVSDVARALRDTSENAMYLRRVANEKGGKS